MTTVISVENLSKTYRLGQIGTGTFSRDLEVWWAKMRRKPNPLLRIGQTDHGNRDGEELWALRDVSFTVDQGEVLGIIGRNGAGKSTLLKILSRVTAPTSGKIKVKGRIASLLEVGTGFHPELTGRENIYLNGAILGMSKNEVTRKFDEIVDFAEVEKFIDTPVKRYSSGMYVRLAFAVAAHLDPEILVVDEVLAVGDAEFQKKCLGKMGDVAKEGRTVLFVSHNMGAIARLCPRTLLIGAGKIITDNFTEQVVSQYLSTDAKTNGKITWENGIANRNIEEIKVFEVFFLDSKNNVTSYFDVSQSFFLNVKYKIFTQLDYARIGFRITTADGAPILEAYDIDDSNQSRARIPGEYVLKCEIPGNLLRPGEYFVTVGAGVPGLKNLILLDGILMFSIEDASTNTVPVYMQGQRTGILNPQLIRWASCRLNG